MRERKVRQWCRDVRNGGTKVLDEEPISKETFNPYQGVFSHCCQNNEEISRFFVGYFLINLRTVLTLYLVTDYFLFKNPVVNWFNFHAASFYTAALKKLTQRYEKYLVMKDDLCEEVKCGNKIFFLRV